MNVVFCPYDIVVITRPETPNQTTIGFREYPEAEMKKIEALLDRIAKVAIGEQQISRPALPIFFIIAKAPGQMRCKYLVGRFSRQVFGR